MKFPQLLGSFGTGFSTKASIERTVNLYLEPNPQGANENDKVMLKSPGLALWKALGGGVTRGMLEVNSQAFIVVDNQLYNLNALKQIVAQYGSIGTDANPVTMAADPDNLLLVSVQTLYRVFGGALTTPALTFNPLSIIFIKNYWVAIASGTPQFYFTTDPSAWDPTFVQTAEADPNNLLAGIEHRQELFLFGSRKTQGFSVGTDANAPFVPQDQAVISEGILAPATLKASGPYLLWLAQNKDSIGHFIKMDGYTPRRISTPSIENLLRTYSRLDDAVSWTYRLNGQDYYRTTFPTQNTTLEYNLTQDHWTEPLYLNPATGLYEAHRGLHGMSAFGSLLVGDRANGNIYQMSPDFYDDAGDPLRWLRRTPHIVNEHKRIDYQQLLIACETGVGLDGDPATVGHDPQMFLRWSNDAGGNWSNSYARSMGKKGEFAKRLYWGPLGIGRDRVFELSGSDPVKVAITGGSMNATVLSD